MIHSTGFKRAEKKDAFDDRMAKEEEKKEKKKKRKQQQEDGATMEVDGGIEAAANESRENNYDAQALTVSIIAKPLAPRKLNSKVLKTVKKAAQAKHIRRGVKEVVKALRKGEKG